MGYSNALIKISSWFIWTSWQKLIPCRVNSLVMWRAESSDLEQGGRPYHMTRCAMRDRVSKSCVVYLASTYWVYIIVQDSCLNRLCGIQLRPGMKFGMLISCLLFLSVFHGSAASSWGYTPQGWVENSRVCETTLTGEFRFHISSPLGIEPGSLMTGSKQVDHWTSGTEYKCSGIAGSLQGSPPPQQPTMSVVKLEEVAASSVKLGQKSCMRSSGIITLSHDGLVTVGDEAHLRRGPNDQSRRGH